MTVRALRCVAVTAALVLSGCTGGEPDDAPPTDGVTDATESSATTAPPTGSGPTSAGPSPPRATPGALVGDWQQDVGTLLAALGPPPEAGAPATPDCTGPVTLHFAPGSAFRYSLDGTCTAGGGSVGVSTGFQGTYTDDGAQLSVPGASTRTRVVVDGAVAPTEELDAWVRRLQQPGPYTVAGDTLTYSYTTPAGRAVPLVFERVD